MRKADEITLLDTLIQQTPRNSYLRSMLDHLRPQFDIRSDFSTLPDIALLESEGVALVEQNAKLKRLNADVAKQLQDQRRTQAYMFNRVKALKDEVMQAGAMLESALDNFTKE
jgi:hypothetical protein